MPLLSANPAGVLGYAWRIADTAVLEEERGGVERGVMGEPVGAGVCLFTYHWLLLHNPVGMVIAKRGGGELEPIEGRRHDSKTYDRNGGRANDVA